MQYRQKSESIEKIKEKIEIRDSLS